MFSSNASQVSNDANYIEDVFSTWLYTGNGSTQTITNGIDLAGKGGIVWMKSRNNAYNNIIIGTGLSSTQGLNTNATNGATAIFDNTLNSDGWTINTTQTNLNASGSTMVSWTFREQPKFFDVVTYTGNGGTLSVSHALASKPGCIIIKKTSGTGDWLVCTRKSDGNIYAMYLNTTAGQFYDGTEGSLWTSSAVSINWINSNVAGGFNDSGATYVMYVLAHNAGGFGLTGTDNVISCGSVLGGAEVNLGYEPQWVLAKASGLAANWFILDTMRGFTGDTGGSAQVLRPNESSAESTNNRGYITSTGFVIKEVNGADYIYIAIRRGPMKVPTDGTTVFAPIARTGTGSATTQETGLNGTDLAFTLPRTAAGNNWIWVDRLRGGAAGSAARIQSNNTSQEFADQSMSVLSSTQTTISYGGGGSNGSGVSYIVECFKRAPGFFDEVCYTGTGSALNPSHNLGVVPELKIIKSRSGDVPWIVGGTVIGGGINFYMFLETNAIVESTNYWSSGSDSAATFSTRAGNSTSNSSGQTYVAYLFASCPGVSKVFSFTGNGSSQTINCGFAAGSRFVLIKRTDSTGDWYVWDSTRGIVSGNDPHLSLNTTAAEVTTDDSVDTDSTGFIVNQNSATNVNVNGATYIGLAVA